MADISLSQAHHTDLENAKSKIHKVAESVQEEFPSLVDSIDWNATNTEAQLKGKGFTGDFKVDDTKVSIDIKLSLFAKPFKGKVEDQIRERMTKVFT